MTQTGKQLTAEPGKLFDEVQAIDDQLGAYSDHEGDEYGPTCRLWRQGREAFERQCERAIQDHQQAIAVWKKLRVANRTRA